MNLYSLTKIFVMLTYIIFIFNENFFIVNMNAINDNL